MPKVTEAEMAAVIAVKNEFGKMLVTHIQLLEAALGVTVEDIHITRNERDGLTINGNIGFHHEDIKELAVDMENFRKSAN